MVREYDYNGLIETKVARYGNVGGVHGVAGKRTQQEREITRNTRFINRAVLRAFYNGLFFFRSTDGVTCARVVPARAPSRVRRAKTARSVLFIITRFRLYRRGSFRVSSLIFISRTPFVPSPTSERIIRRRRAY